MADLSNFKTLCAILERNGFNLKKSLGQNFLIDPTVCPQMADEACADADAIIEIGPGAGVLTVELAKRAKKVVSIEIDEKLRPVLKETLAEYDNVEVVFGDVMKIDLNKLIDEKLQGMKIAVCANLPYYITSPIIMMLLESNLAIESITVMVQKEAADQLCAEMGTRECGAVTAAVRFYCTPSLLFNVPRDSFMPPPKVDSAVIKLDISGKEKEYDVDAVSFFKVIKAAFSMRRKTLVNCLSNGLKMDKQAIYDILDSCEIDRNARGEQLSMEQFTAIANTIKKDVK